MSRANKTQLARWLTQIDESQQWLADKLGCASYQAVQHWISGRRKVPDEHVASIRSLMITSGYTDLSLGRPRLIKPGDGNNYFDWS
jgi:hypothetical protein